MPTISVIIILLALGSQSMAKWNQDRFEIGAWRPPVAGYSTDASYAQMAAAGFTLVTGAGFQADSPEAGKAYLDMCRQHGIEVLIRDPRIPADPKTPFDEKALDAMIADYHDHPALYGYFLKDEPSGANYPQLAEIQAYLQKKDPPHLPYINLFPCYGGPTQLAFDDYDGYVTGFVKTVKPSMISFDHYMFMRNGTMRADFFRNLEITRREALKAGIPLWVIIQALEDATRYRPPTLAQIYWQVNCSLAYGAKSIWYYPYWSSGDPAKPEEWHYLGVVLPDGKPGPQYAAAKEINPKLKALGPLLMSLKSVSVMHLGDVPLGAKPFRADALIKEASGDQIIIGRFEDKSGRPYLMLVNRDFDKPGKVELTLNASKVEEVGGLAATESSRFSVQGSRLAGALVPAEMAVFRLD
jgi:hypothetical protein